MRKPDFVVSDQVLHKLGCTGTEYYFLFFYIVRDSKFRIWEVEGLYYLCYENKGADQLHSYCAADRHLCFRICKKHVHSQCSSGALIAASLERVRFLIARSRVRSSPGAWCCVLEQDTLYPLLSTG